MKKLLLLLALLAPTEAWAQCNGVFNANQVCGTGASPGLPGPINTSSLPSGGLTIGATTITSGTTQQVLFNNAGVLGEITKAASSVLISSAGSVPSWATTLPSGLTIPSPTISGSPTFSSALSVPNGGSGVGTFTANLPLIGNGTSALTQGTRSGNTTEFGTVSGALVSGNCVKSDASGNLVDAATTCGGGGSSLTVGGTTIVSGTSGRVEFNNAGVLGEYAITGTVNVVMSTSPTITTPTITTSIAFTSSTQKISSPGASSSSRNISFTDTGFAGCTFCVGDIVIGGNGAGSSLSGTGGSGSGHNIIIGDGAAVLLSQPAASTNGNNTIIGDAAAAHATTLGSSVIVGRAAANAQVIGSFNTIIGHGASIFGDNLVDVEAIGGTAGGLAIDGSGVIPAGYPNAGRTEYGLNGDTDITVIGDGSGKCGSAARKQSFAIGAYACIPLKDNVGILGNGLTSLQTAGVLWSGNVVSTNALDSNQTITAAQICGGVLVRSGLSTNRTDTFDTAANIVTGSNCPGTAAEETLSRIVYISNTTNVTETIAANASGGTLSGSGAVPPNTAAEFLLQVTNTASGGEAYTITRVGGITSSIITIGSTGIGLGQTAASLTGVTSISLNGQLSNAGIQGFLSSNTTTGRGVLYMNTTGNYGVISAHDAHTWTLGYAATQVEGTAVLSWTDNGAVTIAPNNNITTITGSLTVSALANVATTSAVCYNTGTGVLTYDATVGTCTVSDERLKNIGPRIVGALDKLLQIDGVHYTWKDPSMGTGPQIGVGAQTVERVFPELVATDSSGIKSVDYQRLTAPIIEAIRELKGEIDEIRSHAAFLVPSTAIHGAAANP